MSWRWQQYVVSWLLGIDMHRRDFIAFGGAAAMYPSYVSAQQLVGTPLVGLLFAGTELSYVRTLKAFRDGMHTLGRDEGRNVRFEYRFADGYLDRLPRLVAELLLLKPDVIVSSPLPANLAAHHATNLVPIVMANGADPVGFGLVASLAHPGGNVTGLANFAELLASKQLDFLRELLPGLSRVAMLVNVSNSLHVPQVEEMRAATDRAKIEMITAEVSAPGDLIGAFEKLEGKNIGALLVPPDTLFLQTRKQIAQLAAMRRLPAIYGFREHVLDGGLMSYGPDLAMNFFRSASYVDRILKGVKPADLPVEQPSKIELLINNRVAKALGIEIPAALLARADEVIE
jgi:putative ABC transport system substrate-binding protein